MMLRPVLPTISDSESQSQNQNQNQPLTTFLDATSTSSNIEHDMLLKARAMCVNVAQKLLHIIESSMCATESPLPPPWYTVFCSFCLLIYLPVISKYMSLTHVLTLDIHSCAVVFLTGLLYPPSRANSTEEAGLVSAFNRCLAALKVFEGQSRTARRCSQSLAYIKRKLFRNSNGNSEFFTLQTTSID